MKHYNQKNVEQIKEKFQNYKTQSQKNMEARNYLIDEICVRGIYRLKYKGEVVYIGQSKTNVMKRICQHIDEGVKIFDSFTFTSCKNYSDYDLNQKEMKLIQRYWPKYNVIHNK